MNRKERRALEKGKVTEKFDPEKKYRLKFDIKVPGGLIRDKAPSQRSGQLDAENEVDLTRGMFVRLLETFGFVNTEQAVIGLFASVVNPFPKRMRGALAYAIIQGTGLMIDTDEVEVCVFCEAEKQMMLSPDQPEIETDTCAICFSGADEPEHDDNTDEWLHDFEEPDPDPLMLDSTQHLPNCDARPLGKDEAPIDRNIAEPQWKEIEATVVLMPVMYEPLNKEPSDDDLVIDGEPVVSEEEVITEKPTPIRPEEPEPESPTPIRPDQE